MSVRHGLLGLLAEGSQHGYELKRRFEEVSGGFWDLNYGQIYITLDRLVDQDLVEMHVEPSGDTGGRERKVYTITHKGLAEFRRWLQRPVTRTRPLRDEVFVKLALMDPDDPGPIRALVAEQRSSYLIRMAELTRQKQRLAMTPSHDAFMTDLLVDAALFHAEADLRWLEHCEARIDARAERRA